MRLLAVPLLAICAYAHSIAVDVMANREIIVHEHYSQPGPSDFVFLASPCVRIENIKSAGGLALEAKGTGPWITVQIPPMASVDLTYEAAPISASPRTCAVPVLMPKHAIDSVSITITDHGSRLRHVSVPQLIADSASTKWTATFPAVPSNLQLQWDAGNAPAATIGGPAGLFFWNFYGLVGVLVIWTAAYLLWARRQAS